MNALEPGGETAAAIPRASMAVAALSTIVEWYDFTLYLYVATILGRVFFGGGTGALGSALASFALAYLARPIGALLFGQLGDRLGRRRALLVSMALMSGAMLLTACLPTYRQVGPVAGLLLLGLRLVMGAAVGGEYTTVVAYLLEGAPAGRRGLVTSLAAASSEVGGLLAVGVAALTTQAMNAAALDRWGWRIPFLVGAALAGSVWLARRGMAESPEFDRQRLAGSVPAAPIRTVLARHPLAVLRGFAISALGSVTYYVGIAYVPVFLTSAGGRAEEDALWLGTLAAVAVIAVTPLAGWASDRWGRRTMLVALALAAALLPLATFRLMAGGGAGEALAGVMLLAALGGAVSAVGAIATAELFPGEGRLTGLALGATTATALFGGLTPWAADRMIARTGWPLVPGAMIALVALAVLPLLLRLPGPERR